MNFMQLMLCCSPAEPRNPDRMRRMLKSLIDALIRLAYRLTYRAILSVWFFTRPTIYGVFIAVWHANRILIVRNSYRKWYIVPCGGIKPKETIERAAVRELFEEVGIKSQIGQIRYVGKYAERYKYALDIGHFFELELATRPKIEIDNREVIWAEFMAPEEAGALNLHPLVRMYLSRHSSIIA